MQEEMHYGVLLSMGVVMQHIPYISPVVHLYIFNKLQSDPECIKNCAAEV